MENEKNPTDCSAGFLEILKSREILEGVAEHLHGVSGAVGVTPLVVIPRANLHHVATDDGGQATIENR